MFKKSAKFLVLIVLILALSGFTYAYAASNILPATSAGDGAEAVTGYTVTNVLYNLNSTNPDLLDSVTFTLSAPADEVSIRLVTTGSTWYPCTIATSTSVTCLTSAAVLSIDTLQVVATGS